MTVFISQDVEGRNFLSAEDHGELKLIMPALAQVVLTAKPAIRKMKRALKDFSDEDFLLLSGDPIIMALAVSIALEMNRGRATLLKWDRQRKRYYRVFIDLWEKEDA